MKKYYARMGANFKKELAQKYGKRLETIATKNKGKIKPITVVEDARSNSSPFHNYFVWDDTKAAEKYRLQQARELINHIVEVIVIEGKPSTQRSFFNVVNGGGERVYVTLQKAVTTKSYRLQLINQLITVLQNATQLMEMFRSYEKQ